MHNQLQITYLSSKGTKDWHQNRSKYINVKAKGFWAFCSNQNFFLRKKTVKYWMKFLILYNNHFHLALFYNP